MKNKIITLLEKAVASIGGSTSIELTPSKGHGDFSTNVAMKLAKHLGDSPQNIAKKIANLLKADFIDNVEIAGPVFINIFLNKNATSDLLKNILLK